VTNDERQRIEHTAAFVKVCKHWIHMLWINMLFGTKSKVLR